MNETTVFQTIEFDQYINILETLKTMQKDLETQQYKLQFADAMCSFGESISVDEMAILLKQSGVETGETRLYDWLRANGYVQRLACGVNVPTTLSKDLGIMDFNSAIKITPKGKLYLFQQVMAQKDAINQAEQAKHRAERDRKNEARRQKRQAQRAG